MIGADARISWLDAAPAAPRWRELLIAVAATLVTVIGLLAVAGPWQALALGAGLGAATAFLRWPRAGLYFMAAFVIGHWPWNLSRYVGALVIACALLWLMRRRQPLIPRDTLFILCALYVVAVLVSIISPTSRVEILSGPIVAVNCMALVWLCLALVDSRRSVRRVVGAMVAAGVVTALVGFIQAYTHFTWPASTLAEAQAHAFTRSKPLLDLHGWMGVFRIDSITGTPDFLGVAMMTLMPFVICWGLRQRRVEGRVAALAVLAILSVAHVLSFTRGALVITPLVLLVTVWLISRKYVLPMAFGLVAALLVMLTWTPLRERILAIFQLTRSSATGELDAGAWRLHVVPTAFEMMWQRPFLGVGSEQQVHNWPSSAGDLVPLTVPGIAPPLHNAYLLAGVELGLAGLAIVLALVFTTLIRLGKLARRFERRGELELASYAKAAFAAFGGLMLACMLYPLLGTYRYFWLLIGLAAALSRLERALPDPESPILYPAGVER